MVVVYHSTHRDGFSWGDPFIKWVISHADRSAGNYDYYEPTRYIIKLHSLSG